MIINSSSKFLEAYFPQLLSERNFLCMHAIVQIVHYLLKNILLFLCGMSFRYYFLNKFTYRHGGHLLLFAELLQEFS